MGKYFNYTDLIEKSCILRKKDNEMNNSMGGVSAKEGAENLNTALSKVPAGYWKMLDVCIEVRERENELKKQFWTRIKLSLILFLLLSLSVIGAIFNKAKEVEKYKYIQNTEKKEKIQKNRANHRIVKQHGYHTLRAYQERGEIDIDARVIDINGVQPYGEEGE